MVAVWFVRVNTSVKVGVRVFEHVRLCGLCGRSSGCLVRLFAGCFVRRFVIPLVLQRAMRHRYRVHTVYAHTCTTTCFCVYMVGMVLQMWGHVVGRQLLPIGLPTTRMMSLMVTDSQACASCCAEANEC